jgi:hypothetical protein
MPHVYNAVYLSPAMNLWEGYMVDRNLNHFDRVKPIRCVQGDSSAIIACMYNTCI